MVLQDEPEAVSSLYPERLLIWRKLVWEPAIQSVRDRRAKTSLQRCLPAPTNPIRSYPVVGYPWTRLMHYNYHPTHVHTLSFHQ